jgi:FMN-dependent NADH-azoreductase
MFALTEMRNDRLIASDHLLLLTITMSVELAVEDLPVLEDEATTGSSTRDIAAVDAEEQKAVKRIAALQEKLQRLESDIIALQGMYSALPQTL